MKKIAMCLLLGLLSLSGAAQDIIVKKNGDEIKAKILELTETTIRYRNFSNPEGPIYNIARGEVFMIKYENGEKEVISATTTPKPAATSAPETAYVQPKPLREKDLIFGARAMAGVGAISISDDGYSAGQSGGALGGSIFMEFFPSSTGTEIIGMAMNFINVGYKDNGKDLPKEAKDLILDTNRLIFDFYAGGRTQRWYYNGGVSVGFLLSAKYKLNGKSANAMDACNVGQFGILGNGGVMFGDIDLGLNASVILNNFYKKPKGSDMTSPSMFLGFHLGYRF